MKTLSRRRVLGQGLRVAAVAALSGRGGPLWAGSGSRRFKLGACDWSLGKMCDPGALELGKELGLDGVQVSLGTVSNGMHLCRGEVQARYREAARETGLAVASLAIGELNSVPYKRDERTIAWVSDSIDVCKAMGCRTVLLAFFGEGDLKGDRAGTDEVVRRLKAVAPKAEQAGVVLGVESWLSAAEHMGILDRVGSPAVQVYYDVANAEKMGYDVEAEIRWLGKKKLICELHLKENDALLGQGRVDFVKVRRALDDIDYAGWMQLEGGIPPGGDLRRSMEANVAFVRRVFPPNG